VNYQRPSMVARRQDADEETFVSALDCVLLVKLDGGSNITLNRDVLPNSRRRLFLAQEILFFCSFGETAWHPDTSQSASARKRARSRDSEDFV
jgi:hypothetical protein